MQKILIAACLSAITVSPVSAVDELTPRKAIPERMDGVKIEIWDAVGLPWYYQTVFVNEDAEQTLYSVRTRQRDWDDQARLVDIGVDVEALSFKGTKGSICLSVYHPSFDGGVSKNCHDVDLSKPEANYYGKFRMMVAYAASLRADAVASTSAISDEDPANAVIPAWADGPTKRYALIIRADRAIDGIKALTTVNGFRTKALCEKAGKDAVEQFDEISVRSTSMDSVCIMVSE